MILRDTGSLNNVIQSIKWRGQDVEASSVEEDTINETVYLYYSEDIKEVDSRFKENTTIYAAEEDELYWAAIHTWASDPDHGVGDILVSLGVEVEYVQENDDGVAVVSFSEELYDIDYHLPFNDAFQEQVGLIMMEFGYESTQILVNGEEIDAPLFVGDKITDRPFKLHEDRKEEYEERN
ncbi:hypothetical protein [Geomicrobium sediminis]|uniref:hypothetical protein n=1 Tax=Geomicrobium sediminis TaxID=1347788 RepID=UPI00195BFB9D|nr:hypothetical protein [Geomicrobium sediminis]